MEEGKKDAETAAHTEPVNQLVLILGVQRKEAEALLKKTNDNVEQAINMYFNSSAQALPKKATPPRPAPNKRRKITTPTPQKQTLKSFFSVPGVQATQNPIPEKSVVRGQGPTPATSETEARKSTKEEKKTSDPSILSTMPVKSPVTIAITKSSVSEMDATVPMDTPTDKYDPLAGACWTGSVAPYLHLARAFDKLLETRSRLKITAILTNMFRSLIRLAPDSVIPAFYLTINTIAPSYRRTELNVGGSTLSKALKEVTGTSREKLRAAYNELGDIGDVAVSLRRNQRFLIQPAPLTIQGVYNTLHKIAAEEGM